MSDRDSATEARATCRVTVDGAPLDVPADQTLLEVCRARGIHVPTLCHDPRLEPDSSCWVCVVEVRAGESWRTEPACSTRVGEGMTVRTESPTIDRARRWALELLLSDHYADCIAPCTDACPASVDIPGYVAAVKDERYMDAIEIIRRTNPLPSVCGRICPSPCESDCQRDVVDQSLAINALKRLASDEARDELRARLPELAPDTGRRVAVVGAGPAGLTCAFFLRSAGHAVTVYDAQERAGGMLRYGIPDYRLPPEVLDTDLAVLVRMGIQFELGRRLGDSLSASELLSGPFDAVFLGLGAWGERRMGIDNESAQGVEGGVEFLESVNAGLTTSVSGHVAVIGGGNAALDAARTALRLGARDVTIYYRRGRAQMPAFAHEIEQALEEGIGLQELTNPVSIVAEDGRIVGLRLQRMALGEADQSGRARPVPVPDSEFTAPVDLLIPAIGETPDRSFLKAEPIEELDTDERSGASNVPGLFAGGDFVTGPSTAVEAIGAGRRAARSIDRYLKSAETPSDGSVARSRRAALAPALAAEYADVSPAPRVDCPQLSVEARLGGFSEVEAAVTPAAGSGEAERCLKCGCNAFDGCELRLLMERYEIPQGGRLRGRAHRYPVAALRPGILLDMNRCIRCARCIRICDQVAEVRALDFVHRGFDLRVQFAINETDRVRCDRCWEDGALCVDTCPSGALVIEDDAREAGAGHG